MANYDAEFPEDSVIDERVLWPMGPTESHGMEDARFVGFVDDDGTVIYYATYTAFDGVHVAPQLLETADFRMFRVTQLTGPAPIRRAAVTMTQGSTPPLEPDCQ